MSETFPSSLNGVVTVHSREYLDSDNLELVTVQWVSYLHQKGVAAILLMPKKEISRMRVSGPLPPTVKKTTELASHAKAEGSPTTDASSA